MSMKQSIIDWLESVPGPTEAQARRWRRVRWGLVGLAVLAEILLWYVLYRMDVNDPPLWLSVPTNCILENIPAAQGHTNFTYTLRNEMPYAYAVCFAFSILVALAFPLFNNNRGAILGVANIIRLPLKKLPWVILGEFAFVALVAWELFFYSSEVWTSSDKSGLANISEHAWALLLWWVPLHGLLGIILGQHLVLVIDLFRVGGSREH